MCNSLAAELPNPYTAKVALLLQETQFGSLHRCSQAHLLHGTAGTKIDPKDL